MAVNRGLYVPINTTGNVGTTELEARLAQAGQYEHNAAGVPRSGLLLPAGTAPAAVVTGAANMSYNLAACYPVICTAANDGVYSFSATGTTNVVTTAAPATNSRIDLIYVKQNDKSKGDPDNLAVFGVVQGVSATTPVAPALPPRALEVARATITSTTTATNTAAITQTFTYAALKGTPVPVRNVTDRATITAPIQGQRVARLDLDPNGNTIETWNGTAWDPGTRHVEFVRVGQADAPANVLWGPGAVFSMLDAAASQNYAPWVSAGAGDAVRLQPGAYLIDWKILNAAGGTVSYWHTICLDGSSTGQANGSSVGRSVTTAVPAADPFFTFGHLYLANAADVFFKFVSSVANAPLHHRIKISKIS